MFLQQFFIEGIGCASYLIGCEGKGVAAVVDPDRDVQQYIDAANTRGLQITHVIETHLHADHVSGNTELASRTGAQIYIHEAANAGYTHQPLRDGDVLELGAVHIAVRHTPGHTPESVTLLISDTTRADAPWIALTGDLLFVGDVGRPDLVGAEAARQMAGDLYHSLFHNLLQEEDHMLIYPGHGAGSLCGRSIGSMRATTLGYERKHNPALAGRTAGDFIEYMTNNLPEQPGNHHRIKAMNRQGPKLLGTITPRPISIHDAIPHFRRGAAMLDTRPKQAFVERHVPGAINLPAGGDLSNRIGFVLPSETPIVLLLSDPDSYEQVVYSLARVGFENVIGYLEDGLRGWEAMGLPVTSGDVEDVHPKALHAMFDDEARPVVIDVREPWEYAQGHVPGSRLIPLGQLSRHVNELDPQQPVAVICQTGSRSQSAAALLAQKGFQKIYNVQGGMNAWQRSGLAIANHPSDT